MMVSPKTAWWFLSVFAYWQPGQVTFQVLGWSFWGWVSISAKSRCFGNSKVCLWVPVLVGDVYIFIWHMSQMVGFSIVMFVSSWWFFTNPSWKICAWPSNWVVQHLPQRLLRWKLNQEKSEVSPPIWTCSNCSNDINMQIRKWTKLKNNNI